MNITLLFNILSLGTQKATSYSKLISDFRNKLPRPQMEATKIRFDEKILNSETIHTFPTFDLSKHKSSLVESDLDVFFNKIRHFDYRLMVFGSYYKSYSQNILRLNPSAENGDFDLFVLQEILNDSSHPFKPFDVLVYHLKWKWRITNRIARYFNLK